MIRKQIQIHILGSIVCTQVTISFICRWFSIYHLILFYPGSKSKYDLKNIEFFLKKYFSSEYSSGHLECSFENPAGKFSPKGRKFFAQCPKMMKKKVFFSKILLFVKIFFWTRRMQFWQPGRNFLVSFWKELSFSEKNLIFFQNRLRWPICCRMRIKWFYFIPKSIRTAVDNVLEMRFSEKINAVFSL